MSSAARTLRTLRALSTIPGSYATRIRLLTMLADWAERGEASGCTGHVNDLGEATWLVKHGFLVKGPGAALSGPFSPTSAGLEALRQDEPARPGGDMATRRASVVARRGALVLGTEVCALRRRARRAGVRGFRGGWISAGAFGNVQGWSALRMHLADEIAKAEVAGCMPANLAEILAGRRVGRPTLSVRSKLELAVGLLTEVAADWRDLPEMPELRDEDLDDELEAEADERAMSLAVDVNARGAA